MTLNYEPETYSIVENARIPLVPRDPSTEVSGTITFIERGYITDADACALTFIDEDGGTTTEHLSTNLTSYNLYTFEPGTFWVKNWSEHEGLAETLDNLDEFEIVQCTGPLNDFGITATLIRIVDFEDIAANTAEVNPDDIDGLAE